MVEGLGIFVWVPCPWVGYFFMAWENLMAKLGERGVFLLFVEIGWLSLGSRPLDDLDCWHKGRSWGVKSLQWVRFGNWISIRVPWWTTKIKRYGRC
ncbi:MAG: hypothetical protein RLZZ490_2357 [Cyanobacteriota bacterium]